MNPKLLLLMSLLSLLGCGKKAAPEYPADTLTTRDGTQITITFFRHASLSIEVGGKYVYVDPVSGYARYAALPKAARTAAISLPSAARASTSQAIRSLRPK